MVEDVQPKEPPVVLLDVARQVTPGWLHQIMVAAIRRGGVDETALADELDLIAEPVVAGLLDRLEQLMLTDVDAQRTTPLTVFREATAVPTAWLRSHDVRPPGPSSDGSFPDDVYRLGPATWSDIDPAMHEPGLMWGAWKAATVLQRRRDEGLR